MNHSLSNYIDVDNLNNCFSEFHSRTPFNHCVVDNFFNEDIADALHKEIPDFDSDFWHEYNNAIEIKKVCNDWNRFPPLTYKILAFLNSSSFLDHLKPLLKISELYPDPGLNGGGWHIHSNGGKLNPHLDYSIHPKLKLLRKLNIIIYLEKGWKTEWGGHFGLYKDNGSKSKDLQKELEPKFNRAVIFDTTQDSWHGLSRKVSTPEGVCRKSLAVYYLTPPTEGVDKRGKALFSPTEDQVDDNSVSDLIQKRSSVKNAASTYK